MELTIAIERYDRHTPFFTGTVSPPEGISLRALEVGESSVQRDGTDRHERMLKHQAFDIAEMSASSFITAIGRDPNLPLVGIPIVPRRFFSAGQIYVSAKSTIRTVADLAGKTVGLHAFQTTLSLLAKGDLKFEYGVPWEKINWVTMRAEIMPLALGDDIRLTTIPAGKDIGVMLCEGEIDALISPQPRKSMLARPGDYRRLFPDVHTEEVRYFRKYGFFPIMHLIVLKRELADRRPQLPRELMRCFEEAKRLAYSYYEDSNYSMMVDGRLLFEQQRADFGDEIWPNGLRANRQALEQLIGYAHDQRLIPAPYAPERLFHPSTHET